MIPLAVRAITAFLAWCVAGVILSWARLPELVRRTLALLTSGLGLVLLVFALSTQGQREAETTAGFLLSGNYVTGRVSATASLRYYAVTAVCLLLGTLGLALPEPTLRGMDRRWLSSAIVLSFGITALRFALEQVAAPQVWTFAVGITWLAPALGAFFLDRVRSEGRGMAALLKALALYALAVRGFVVVLMVAATSLRLGSHYDISHLTAVWVRGELRHFEAGSARQVLMLGVVPQMTFWVAYTIVAGLLGAGVFSAARWGWRRWARGAGAAAVREASLAPLPPES